jgi:hypothetical protein
VSKPRLFSAIAAIAILSLTLPAAHSQAPSSPNTDILKMLQAGLPESTIVNKIHQGAGRWDTSVDALIALKQAGATDAELAALTAESAPPPPPPAQALQTPQPSEPVDLLGGQLLRTRQGDPYLLFQATEPGYFPDGRPNNTAFLMAYQGAPAVLIPTTIVFDDDCVVGNLIVAESAVWFDGYVSGCGEFSNTATVVQAKSLSQYTHEDFLTAKQQKTKWYGEGLKLQSKKLPGVIVVGVYPLVKKAPLFGENHTNTSALRSATMNLFFTDLLRDFRGTVAQIQAAAGPGRPLPDYQPMPSQLKARYTAILTQRLSERASNGNSWLALAQGVQATQQMTSGLMNSAVGISKGDATQFSSGVQTMAAASGSPDYANAASGLNVPTPAPPTPPTPPGAPASSPSTSTKTYSISLPNGDTRKETTVTGPSGSTIKVECFAPSATLPYQAYTRTGPSQYFTNLPACTRPADTQK